MSDFKGIYLRRLRHPHTRIAEAARHALKADRVTAAAGFIHFDYASYDQRLVAGVVGVTILDAIRQGLSFTSPRLEWCVLGDSVAAMVRGTRGFVEARHIYEFDDRLFFHGRIGRIIVFQAPSLPRTEWMSGGCLEPPFTKVVRGLVSNFPIP